MWYAFLRSENSKLLSYRWCQLGIVAAVFIAPFALMCSNVYEGTDTQTVVVAVLQMLYLGQIGAVILGATLFGQEYTHSALRTSLLAVPSRGLLLMAKLTVLSGAVIVTGIASTFLCIICLILENDLRLSIDLIITLVRHAVPVIISGLEIGFISAGLSIMFRSIVIPTAILLSMILGVSQMIFSIFEGVKVTPVMATLNLFLIPVNEVLLLSNVGILTQLFWSVGVIVIAVDLFIRRDVR